MVNIQAYYPEIKEKKNNQALKMVNILQWGVTGGTIRDRIPGSQAITRLQNLQTFPKVPPSSYSTGTGGSFPESKTAEA
jgi:hypothetical protein